MSLPRGPGEEGKGQQQGFWEQDWDNHGSERLRDPNTGSCFEGDDGVLGEPLRSPCPAGMWVSGLGLAHWAAGSQGHTEL